MDRKLKGDIAESSVIAEAIKKNFNVCIPFGDRYPYDLILDNKSKLFKIQIKSIYLASDGRLKCAGSRRTLTNRVETKVKRYIKGDFDFVIAYYMETNDFYIIPEDIFLESNSEFTFTMLGKQRLMKNNPDQFKNNWGIIQ